MSGNTFGKLFSVTTFGESHGDAIGCIVDGCPPNISLSESDIQPDLNRRKPGQSHYTTQRKEDDEIRILSGIFNGRTTGTPIGLLIKNQDHKSKDYSKIRDLFRPSHADYTYEKKYGIRDYRGGGRSSARETTMRVAAGAIAKRVLNELVGSSVFGYVSRIGALGFKNFDKDFIEKNSFFTPDADLVPKLEDLITKLRRDGDSVGAEITVVAHKIPVGLGEPVFDRLDAEICHGLMSINAVKGVEIGDGFDCVSKLGSEFRDEIDSGGFLSNSAGGILGGISTGQDIIARLALKPTSSIRKPGRSLNTKGEEVEVVTTGRHDPCVGIRAVPIAEAMIAITLLDHYLRDKAQNKK